MVAQALLDVLRDDVITETRKRQISTCFSCGEAFINGCWEILSTTSFMSRIAGFIQCRAGKAVTTERFVTKMDTQMNALIPAPTAKSGTWKSIPPTSCTDSAHSLFPLKEEVDLKSYNRISKHHAALPVVIEIKKKPRNTCQRRVNQSNQYSFTPIQSPILTSATAVIEKFAGRRTTDPNRYGLWTTDFTMNWITRFISFPMNHPSTIAVLLNAL